MCVSMSSTEADIAVLCSGSSWYMDGWMDGWMDAYEFGGGMWFSTSLVFFLLLYSFCWTSLGLDTITRYFGPHVALLLHDQTTPWAHLSNLVHEMSKHIHLLCIHPCSIHLLSTHPSIHYPSVHYYYSCRPIMCIMIFNFYHS